MCKITKNTLRKIHLWLSVPFGIIITITCLTGAILVFEKEITDVINRRSRFVNTQTNAAPLSLDSIMAIAAQSIPGKEPPTAVTIFNNPHRAYLFSGMHHGRNQTYVNQYSGEILGTPARPAFFRTTSALHRTLLTPRAQKGGHSWGRTAVGISTLFFILALISGIVVWWPSTWRKLRQSLKVRFDKGWNALWYSAHVALGVFAFLLLLLLAGTGLTWSFPSFRNAINSLFAVAKQRQEVNYQAPHPCNTESRYAQWQQTLNLALTQCGNSYKKIVISDGEAKIYPNEFIGNPYFYTTIRPSEDFTSIQTIIPPAANDGHKRRVSRWIFTLHFGNWGGLLSKTLTCLAALIGAMLPITGFYLWIKRLLRKSARQKR